MGIDELPAVPLRRRRNRRRTVLLSALGLVLVAVLIAVAYLASLARSFDSQTVKIPSAFPAETLRPEKPTAGPAANAMNILLLGSDSRGDSVNIAEQGGASNQRSDTMLWVHIPADRKNIYMMSVMRDTWVDIPGVGPAKINAAMAYGGIPLVVQTLEGMFGSRIDHVAIVDFEGFKAITDALGGVEVDVPLAFTSMDGSHSFAAGPQKLNGDQALAFVRERYAFSDGDYQRVKDQQIFLKAVLNTVLTPATLANPLKISDLVGKVSPYISVDRGLDAAAVAELAVSLNGVRGSDVHSFTLPTLGTGTSADGQSIVLRDDAAIAAISKALKDDTLGTYLATAGPG
ncbi:LCP family protein required for cell wall assembly [Arthrobacter stackebrandtii]|uniref:LCP family protein required for cell wall assembly n=1 Tax=Arthrobacter stackebrandtii TaxID=272161 RepID=A0ABS4Z096_9MICC|nr:LCP family protein [Arthrobacter stackebrandtii]MBP2414132.1 LCP family protein required for cell wall assembly [Arthrobacter stackebrandtii]PYG99329.1 transcriptional regulator [Arthrobacter stackebrandtii]